MPLGNLIYRAVKRLMPLDITHVFLLSPDTERKELPAAENISFRILSIDDLHALSIDKDFAISKQFLKDAVDYRMQAVGTVVNKEVVGMCCFAQGEVPAYLNTGGNGFQGIGLDLPENTTYLFKVFIKSEQRGKRLVSLMIQFALNLEQVAAGRFLVTTTDINNRAFRSAIMRMGFQSVGRAAEAVVSGKHFFKVPAPIKTDKSTDARVPAIPIVLKRPKTQTEAETEPA